MEEIIAESFLVLKGDINFQFKSSTTELHFFKSKSIPRNIVVKLEKMKTKETILKSTGKDKIKINACEQIGIISNNIFQKKIIKLLQIIMIINCYIGFTLCCKSNRYI